jgi:hypothetical protein
MIDIDKLEALAKAATPGPWEAVNYGSYDGKDEGWYVDTSADKADIAPDAGGIQPNHWDAGRGRRDMQFIAATNPVVILALIAEVRALRNLESAVRDHRAMYEGTSDEDNMSALSIGDAIAKLDAVRKEETC